MKTIDFRMLSKDAHDIIICLHKNGNDN